MLIAFKGVFSREFYLSLEVRDAWFPCHPDFSPGRIRRGDRSFGVRIHKPLLENIGSHCVFVLVPGMNVTRTLEIRHISSRMDIWVMPPDITIRKNSWRDLKRVLKTIGDPFGGEVLASIQPELTTDNNERRRLEI